MEFNFIQDIRAPQIDSKCVPESSRNLHPLGAEGREGVPHGREDTDIFCWTRWQKITPYSAFLLGEIDVLYSERHRPFNEF